MNSEGQGESCGVFYFDFTSVVRRFSIKLNCSARHNEFSMSEFSTNVKFKNSENHWISIYINLIADCDSSDTHRSLKSRKPTQKHWERKIVDRQIAKSDHLFFTTSLWLLLVSWEILMMRQTLYFFILFLRGNSVDEIFYLLQIAWWRLLVDIFFQFFSVNNK